MPFKKVQDLPDTNTESIDAVKTDAYMRGVAQAIIFDLKQSKFYPYVVGLLSDQLRLFTTTHFSIRELIKASIRKKQVPMLADALSLTREQVEKLYVLALFLESPEKWFRQYLRNAWRKDYERYLLNLEEHKHMERFDEFLREESPKQIERKRKWRKPDSKKDIILVSKKAQAMVKYEFYHPGIKKTDATGNLIWPAYFDRNTLNEYFEFPTPGASLKYIRSRGIRELLIRWHKDYQHLSTYTHVALGKMILQAASKVKDMYTAEQVQVFSEKRRGDALFTSYTAFASACTMAIQICDLDHGGRHQLRKFWETLCKSSLVSRIYWETYGKVILE